MSGARSIMRGNRSVAMPIDPIGYRRDGVRHVFRKLPGSH